MDKDKKNAIINQIISGIIYTKYNEKLYKLVSPDNDQQALANMVYEEALNDNKFENLITRERAALLLQQKGIWTPLNDQQLKILTKSLEDLKIKLYQSFYNKKEQKRILQAIKRTEKGVEKSYSKKYSLDSYTFEFFAEKIREEFLIALCIQDEEGKPQYNYETFSAQNNILLNFFLNLKYNNYVKEEEYREIARTQPFRSLWSIGKQEVFGWPAKDLTEEQKNLILYSQMYDNVYESHERPSDEVIEDDYMLDGWFALQRRESDKDRKQREADLLLNKKGVGKHGGGAGELFVMAESQEQAKQIRDLNDLSTDMKVKQRISAVQQSGQLEEKDLPDVKMDLMNQARQQALNRTKGKK